MRVKEIFYMGRVGREALLIELASVDPVNRPTSTINGAATYSTNRGDCIASQARSGLHLTEW
jgi:hypothetical protein